MSAILLINERLQYSAEGMFVGKVVVDTYIWFSIAILNFYFRTR